MADANSIANSSVCNLPIPFPSVPGVTFKDVRDFPGYCVGDDGTVWSRRDGHGRFALVSQWRQLKAGVKYRKYPAVNLCRDGRIYARRVHQLILEAFVGPRPSGLECCHFPDADPSNNRLTNLRWATRSDNRNDSSVLGTLCVGSGIHTAKLTERQIAEIRILIRKGTLYRLLAARFGVHYDTISLIARNKTWKHVKN